MQIYKKKEREAAREERQTNTKGLWKSVNGEIYSEFNLTWFMAWYLYIKYIKRSILGGFRLHLLNCFQKYNSVVPREIHYKTEEKKTSNSGPHANNFSTFLCISCEKFVTWDLLWAKLNRFNTAQPLKVYRGRKTGFFLHCSRVQNENRSEDQKHQPTWRFASHMWLGPITYFSCTVQLGNICRSQTFV